MRLRAGNLLLRGLELVELGLRRLLVLVRRVLEVLGLGLSVGLSLRS